MFRHDFTGVKEMGDFSPAPKGTYVLEILEAKEGKSQAGDNMVNVKTQIAQGPFTGKWVWHKVTFISAGNPGAGFSKHFVKTIGQPYEGNVNINPAHWVGKRFEADLDVDTYIDKNGETKEKNIVVELRKIGETEQTDLRKDAKEEQIPF